MKSELSLKESNEDEIKKVHEQELRELEDKLQVHSSVCMYVLYCVVIGRVCWTGSFAENTVTGTV